MMHRRQQPGGSIRVLVSGPHHLLCQALLALLSTLPGIEPVAQTDNPADWLSASTAPPPDVVVLVCPRHEDIGQVPALRQAHPHIRILALASTWTVREVQLALELGSVGCLSTAITGNELAVALRQVIRDEITLSPDLAWAYMSHLAQKESTAEDRYESLTSRERGILQLLCQGLSNKEIAQRLFLSVRTVEGHVANLYRKLDVHSRTEAMLVAVRGGLIAEMKRN